jgi:hypothetical protein
MYIYIYIYIYTDTVTVYMFHKIKWNTLYVSEKIEKQMAPIPVSKINLRRNRHRQKLTKWWRGVEVVRSHVIKNDDVDNHVIKNDDVDKMMTWCRGEKTMTWSKMMTWTITWPKNDDVASKWKKRWRGVEWIYYNVLPLLCPRLVIIIKHIDMKPIVSNHIFVSLTCCLLIHASKPERYPTL